MTKQSCAIEGIPAVLWGKKSSHVFIAVHGNMSNKEDVVIRRLAEIAVLKGYQVISFDLPQHGDRKQEHRSCKVQFCVEDLKKIMHYAKQQWEHKSLFGCSLGAYFSLLACGENTLEQSLFLSPVVDMERLIYNIMRHFAITLEVLQEQQVIQTPIGQMLYWDDYVYVTEHPIKIWDTATSILYGANDNVSEPYTIEDFAATFHCAVDIMAGGEHYFHTNEQLDVYTQWLNKRIVDKTGFIQ